MTKAGNRRLLPSRWGGDQMSESWRVAAFLALSGGFQDSYSYLARGGVFANAQTGNIVLLSARLAARDFAGAAKYLLPLAAFALGAFVSAAMRRRVKVLHWRQPVLLSEIAILALVGLLPRSADPAANALASFACAMQVQAFRKLHGNGYASTMCIGNLRAFSDGAESALSGGGPEAWRRTALYAGVLALFAAGAFLGGWLVPVLGRRAVWICCPLLAGAFVAMFRHNPER